MELNKKTVGFGAIVVIITMLVTSFSNIVLGNKVIVDKSEYEQLKKYSKMLYLEDVIKEKYYIKPDDEKLVTGSIKGMFSGLEDPYSTYMTADEFKRLLEDTEGAFGGIGVYISAGDDNLITVVSPIEGTPGYKAGIKSGDKILKINDKEFMADEMDFAIKEMKGEPGTKVNITIYREGEDKPLEFNMKRELIKIESIESKMEKDDIGYIRIKSFDEHTYKDFKEALEGLKEKGMKGLVIDLRYNPGGLLNVCEDIADELLGEAVIVYTRNNKGDEEYYNSDEKHKLDMPITVLVNEWSASASEILSGALRDNDAGILVGKTTFGKGLVQQLYPLSDETGFKLTTAQYFTPSGEYIHKKGIKPDIEIEDEKEQLKKALEVTKEEIEKRNK
ncbi:MAG: S41 family peptidase [Peptostreptococcaceae bacterium]|nr:S41 family peptidase [Peptostreptococcaceae bacterium]